MRIIISNTDFSKMKTITHTDYANDVLHPDGGDLVVHDGDTNVTQLNADITHADINDTLVYDGNDLSNVTYQRDAETGEIVTDQDGNPVVDTSVVISTTVVE